ncbi:MAG: helix-turn-helix domain-containing protein, partial [Caulobacteraceae bacterium]
ALGGVLRMPLDIAAVSESEGAFARKTLHTHGVRLNLDHDCDVGAALGRLRRRFNLSVDQVAEATKIQPVHVEAIEAFDLARLPSRPFTLGYLRAYADLLGLDPAEVVARFKTEAPSNDNRLRPPAGIDVRPEPRLGWAATAVVLALMAIVGWNLSRHATAAQRRPSPARAAAEQSIADISGPAQLGAPLPAPPEASMPAIYQPPGLIAAAADGGSADAALAAQRAADAAQVKLGVVSGPIGAPFIAQGPVWGAAAGAVILQATSPTSLIVRGDGGAVYFARQLAAGEAWRAPDLPGLTIDVGEPDSVEVYENGLSKGLLTRPQTPLAKLEG